MGSSGSESCPRRFVDVQVRDSGVQTPALDRALALLEFISAHSEGVTQADIRKGLGFSANLVFRLTKALVTHGYVEPASRKLLTLAQTGRWCSSRGTDRWLRNATQESAHIGVRSGFECIVLDRVVGPHPFKCYVEAGARALARRAPGKVMLAFLPQDELQATLRRMPLEALTPHTITSRTEFAKHLAQVRQQGYALDLGETVEGHHCLGAPVFDADEPLWPRFGSPRRPHG